MITYNNDGSYRMSQLLLVDCMIESAPGMTDTCSSKYHACSSVVCTKDQGGKLMKEYWNYRLVIRIPNFLGYCTYPEMAFAVHQCTRFFNDTKRNNQAVKKLIQYHLYTNLTIKNGSKETEGIIYKPNKSKTIDKYMNTSLTVTGIHHGVTDPHQ